MKKFILINFAIAAVVILAVIIGRLSPQDQAKLSAAATLDRRADSIFPTYTVPSLTPTVTPTPTPTPNREATEAVQKLAILAAQQTIDLATRQAGELTAVVQATIDQATAQAIQATQTRAAQQEERNATATAFVERATAEAVYKAELLAIARVTDQAITTGTAAAATIEAARTQSALEFDTRRRQAAIDATLEAAQVADVQLALERSRMINKTYAGLQVASLPALAAVVLALFLFIFIRLTRYKVLKPDERGKLPTVINGPHVINPNRMATGIDNTTNPYRISESNQVRVTLAETVADVARAMPGKAGQVANRLAGQIGSAPAAEQADPVREEQPVVAQWNILASKSGQNLLLGAGRKGYIELDPDKAAPSLVFAGTTGAGKTRYGIIPAVVGALNAGNQVILGDRAGVDFQAIIDHPNASLVTLDDPEDAIGLLESSAKEISRRENTLAAEKAWLWSQIDPIRYGPRTWIVLDEFGTLGDELGNAARSELWRWARFIAARGRKTGIHLILAVQNPTRANVDPTIIRNCTKVSFRVQDAAASLAILGAPGAQLLTDHKFLAMISGALLPGTAFAPSNDEVRQALSKRAPVLPPSKIIIDSTARPADPQAGDDVIENTILAHHGAGLNVTDIATKVFGYANGRTCSRVSEILRRHATTTGDAALEGG